MVSRTITLSLPPLPEYAQVARMTAAAVASQSQMGFDVVEDIKMVTEEAFILALDACPESGTVALTFETGADTLTLSCAIEGVCRPVEDEADNLSVIILRSMCTEFEITPDPWSLRLVCTLSPIGE